MVSTPITRLPVIITVLAIAAIGPTTLAQNNLPVVSDMPASTLSGTRELAIMPEEMSLVPAGEYLMGDHFKEGHVDELPVHAVYIGSFYMDRYEVTNQRYCDYLNSAYSQGSIEVRSGVVYAVGGNDPYCDTYSADDESRIHFSGGTFTITAGKEDHPMGEVSWYGAAAYANWRSIQEGREACYNLSTWVCDFSKNGYRLPTEAEWEKATRGGEHDPYYRYPWGDSSDGSKANYEDSGDPYETGPYPWTTPAGYYNGSQVPLGSDMANGYGLYDMAGNLWEWCNDWYNETYYGSSPYDNPHGPASGSYPVLRGGSWHVTSYRLRCAERNGQNPEARSGGYGFRLALHSGYCVCGDIDHDGQVTRKDFATFVTCFGLTAPSPGCNAEELFCSDLDGSGEVNLADFVTFARLFGQPATGSPPNCG